MTTRPVEVVDSLALLSTKVASNVFDLSSGMHHVSIRDQMVRAQLAVRDLQRGDPQFNALLVVGAGVAGICAALEAIKRGVDRVVVIEANDHPFHLLRGVEGRHVGPFMYEWPSSFSRNQSYPRHRATTWHDAAEAPLQWAASEPVSADELATLLTQDLVRKVAALELAQPGALKILVGVDKGSVRRFVQDFARTEAARAVARLQRRVPILPQHFDYRGGTEWPTLVKGKGGFEPDYVVLAAGMGSENTVLVAKHVDGRTYRGENFVGARFWAQDGLLSPATADQDVAVFGGGDGALQDVLRALTGRRQPLELMAFLESAPVVREALARATPRLLDADRQSRQFGTWTVRRNEYRTLDNTCRTLARELAGNSRVVRRVGQALRQGAGSVTLFVRDGHFDKAYLLNRFIVHLIEACGHAQNSMWSGRMRLRVLRGRWCVGYASLSNGQHDVEIATRSSTGPVTTAVHRFDTLAVRYGIEPGSVPGAQMIQVSDRPSRQRTSLSRVELPFVAETD